MFAPLADSFRSVDRYLREHALVYAGVLLAVTAAVWTLTGIALGDSPEMAMIEGVVFGVVFAALSLIGRRFVSSER